MAGGGRNAEILCGIGRADSAAALARFFSLAGGFGPAGAQIAPVLNAARASGPSVPASLALSTCSQQVPCLHHELDGEHCADGECDGKNDVSKDVPRD